MDIVHSGILPEIVETLIVRSENNEYCILTHDNSENINEKTELWHSIAALKKMTVK